MFSPRAMIQAAVGYVRKNPDEVVRAAVNATGLRFGVPIATLRWFAGQLQGPKAPKDVEISATPPALRFSAVVDAMGTPVRASAAIKIDEVTITEESVRVGVRLREVKLSLVGESESPVATLIKSGALDLSKPGNLVKFMPNKPPALVEAEGDRIVIDLMKDKKFAENPKIRRVLDLVAPVLSVKSIRTEDDALVIALRAKPSGVPQVISRARMK